MSDQYTDLLDAADRIEQLTAERDAAYANGYADAETEISKSALGQKVDFLSAEYANAIDQIKDLTAERDALGQDNHRWKMECENFWRDREKALTAERDRLREALQQFLIEYDVVDLAYAEPSSLTEAVLAARAALKGESHE